MGSKVLVRELYDLRDKYGYEVNVVSMEKLSRAEQVSLMARTTVRCSLSLIKAGHRSDELLTDHDGCPRERPDIAHVDAAHSSINRD